MIDKNTNDEMTLRNNVITQAKSWLGTPYLSNACVKGKRGGTDCAMLLVAVYADAGITPKEFDPRPYPAQWHMHKGREKYLEYVLSFAREIPGPPKPGDIVLFKIGHLYAHGGIVIDWPLIINARQPNEVMYDDVISNNTGKHALKNCPARFFTFW